MNPQRSIRNPGLQWQAGFFAPLLASRVISCYICYAFKIRPNMKPMYYYLQDDRIHTKPVNIINGIGYQNYKEWKKLDRLFLVRDALSASDFIVYCLGANQPTSWRHWPLLESMMKSFGVDYMFLGTIYALQRKIIVTPRMGDFYCFIEGYDDPKNDICGCGPSPLQAIADLHRELTICKAKTFLP